MKAYFEGWYYKHQAGGKSLAIIVGRAQDEAFIQVITPQGAYGASYPLTAYEKRGDGLRIGASYFSSKGLVLDILAPGLTLKGEISYGNLTPIRGDIMGPFRHFPMECHHGIVSMNHSLSGSVRLNGEVYAFTGGRGYIESDRGRSFPRAYTWAHCNDFTDCSITAAIAKIPFYGLRFWGCICVVHLRGREYRLATYKRVKIIRCAPGVIHLKQGDLELYIEANTQEGHALKAPHRGKMGHMIKENIACPVYMKFTQKGEVLFEGESDLGSYEEEMGKWEL